MTEPERITCPVCGGTGETYRNEERNEWGIWDRDSETCFVCDGRGSVVPDGDGGYTV